MNDLHEEHDDALVGQVVDLHEAIVHGNGTDTSIESGATAPESSSAKLAGMASCLRMLEQVRRDESKRGVSTTGEMDPQQLPDSIGRFRVRQFLGSGTYGLVYRAEDPNLGRSVAIKIPRPEVIITPSLRERFLREANFAAVLDHPNILRIYEAGQADGLSYIVSAHCNGPTLAEWLQHHQFPMDPHDAARLIETLAGAVHYAHTRGVIHRDLKPSNVLLDGERDSHEAGDRSLAATMPPSELPASARISDFGLAKMDGGHDTTLTRTGAIIGTPAYMSPEQAAGDISAAGTLSDIHALGAMLYELLVGTSPFKESTVVATLQAVQVRTPLPPRKLRHEVPTDLSAICMKCLEKNPSLRYASADELARDLRRYLDGETVTARAVGPTAEAWRWARRNPIVATLAAAFVLTLSGVSIGSVIVANRLKEQRDRATIAETELKKTITQLEARLTEYSREEMVHLQTKVIEKNPLAFDAYYERGENHWANGNYEEALADFAKVMEIVPNFPWAKADTAWIYLVGPPEMRDVETALQLCEGTVELSPRNWSLRFTQGIAYYRGGQFADALPHLEEGIRLREDGGNSLHLFFYAMTLHQLGREAEAKQAWQDALERLTETQWEFHDREVKPVQEECRQLLFSEVSSSSIRLTTDN